MLNLDARKTKDPQLSELAGLTNVKDFYLTIVLAGGGIHIVAPNPHAYWPEPTRLTHLPFPVPLPELVKLR